MVNFKSANLNVYSLAAYFLKLVSFTLTLAIAIIMSAAKSDSAGAGSGGLMSSYGRGNKDKDCSGNGGGGVGCAIGSRWRGIRKGGGQGRGGGGGSSCDAGGGGRKGGVGYYNGGQGREAPIILNQQLLANISLILNQQLEKQAREGGRLSSGYGNGNGNTASLAPPSKSPLPQSPYQIQILGHPQGYDWTQLLRLK